MPDVLNLAPRAVAQQPPQIVHGYVSASQPAPTAFSSPLFVVIPQWNPDYFWKLPTWPACNGSALPAQGAECLLVWDDQRSLRCVWWAGTAGFAPTGPAGGALTGTYPNPGLATLANAVGDLIPSAAPTRTGCLLCDGTAYSRTTYAALFAVTGTTYGPGDGSTTFNVPDLRGRLPLGAGTGTAANATAWALGQQPVTGAGGEQAHAQSTSEMASHRHEVAIDTSGGFMASNPNSVQKVTGSTPTGSGILSDRGGGSNTSGSTLINTAGSGAPANILPPVSVINWFIIR